MNTLEEAQEALDYCYDLHQKRQAAVDRAVDLLEALVLEEDADPDKIEEIIGVLTSV